MVQDAITSFDPSLRAGRHEVTLDVPDALALQSYPGALGQVLSNLISNALRLSDAPTVEVTAGVVLGGVVTIAVRDDGRGLEAAAGHALHHALHQGAVALGLADRHGAPVDAEHVARVEEHQVQRIW